MGVCCTDQTRGGENLILDSDCRDGEGKNKLEEIFWKGSWGTVIRSDTTEEERRSRHTLGYLVSPWTKNNNRGRGEDLRMCG